MIYSLFTMDSVITLVFLLSGLLTPGYAIICTQCTSSLSSCTGYTANCASKLVCISIYESTRVGNTESFQFVRGCGYKSDCDQLGLFAIPNGKYRFSATCCNSDNCTPNPPSLPPVNNTSNNKQCPHCVSETSKDCNSNQMMACMGDETKCALQNSEVTIGSNTQKSSIRGCATKSFCKLGTQTAESGGVKRKIVTKCSACTALYSAITLLLTLTISMMTNVF
ncbi:phospholipase A2 inhibitor and Ly6/PLAUR domain-containing protein-like [Pyxicephalus adspersus]|uniref:phospholipase A2 inhibitor and Ly6/PLAUR domain-containing protein-like n=1 Tax=Pyxicephalus adspersus TaxID=30357 RepID=UPI003B5B715C